MFVVVQIEGVLRTLLLLKWVAVVVFLVVIMCCISTFGGEAADTAAPQVVGSRSNSSGNSVL